MKRYLVLIHFASKASRSASVEVRGRNVVNAVVPHLGECAAVLTSEFAVAFCGTSVLSAERLWSVLKVPMDHGDNLSVIELGADITTTHPGLSNWHGQTRWLVRQST